MIFRKAAYAIADHALTPDGQTGPPIARLKWRRGMKFALIAGLGIAVSLSSPLAAQNALPATTVTAPKPKPARTVRRQVIAPADPLLPVHPDPNSKVGARAWNAPGVLNLQYMTDAQFAEFQRAHPTAQFFGRCYMGQDPDPNIRFTMNRIQYGTPCGS